MTLREALNKILHKFNREIVKVANTIDSDFVEEEFKELLTLCSPYTMTLKERMYTLYKSTKYIIENKIEGDFVECGVWRGGRAMLITSYLKLKDITN